jgi:hypothetical protein
MRYRLWLLAVQDRRDLGTQSAGAVDALAVLGTIACGALGCGQRGGGIEPGATSFVTRVCRAFRITKVIERHHRNRPRMFLDPLTGGRRLQVGELMAPCDGCRLPSDGRGPLPCLGQTQEIIHQADADWRFVISGTGLRTDKDAARTNALSADNKDAHHVSPEASTWLMTGTCQLVFG